MIILKVQKSQTVLEYTNYKQKTQLGREEVHRTIKEQKQKAKTKIKKQTKNPLATAHMPWAVNIVFRQNKEY